MNLKEEAVEQAIGNSALSGFHPSEFARGLYAEWAKEKYTVAEVVAVLKQHHCALEAVSPSDGLAQENLLGITDSVRMKAAEADITTMRMAELVVDPI